MHGDAMSFASSSICDEQWHEAERPLLLPCVQEESTKQRFVVIASVFDTDTYDNERSRAMGHLRLARVSEHSRCALWCFYMFSPALQQREAISVKPDPVKMFKSCLYRHCPPPDNCSHSAMPLSPLKNVINQYWVSVGSLAASAPSVVTSITL